MVDAPRATSVMVLGTASHVGKSIIATALCRILARRGLRVAPFKAQNMALNSAATPDGLEIGRAQALQAEAAGIAARADMNPVLLKPTSNAGSQLVLNGRMHGELHARDFAGTGKRRLWPHVVAAYERLASDFDVLVIEGAGSPAEINLRAGDIVNMAVAHLTGARALLVADIDRGGAFAAVAGTFALLDEADRRCIAAYCFNKFRGVATLLDPGIAELNERTGSRCAGIIPYLDTTGLDEEDSVGMESRLRSRWGDGDDRLRVAVVALPHIANFTDFDALAEEPSVDLRYVRVPEEMRDADVVILPGTKSTIADLRWMREQRLDRAIVEGMERERRLLVGICGGMQMLGSAIDDPFGIEGGGRCEGLGLFSSVSTFAREKTTVAVTGECSAFGAPVGINGYEIHAGVTSYGSDPSFAFVHDRSGVPRRDGAVAKNGRAIGTYVHGLFADDTARHAFLRWAHDRCGRTNERGFVRVQGRRQERLDALADSVEHALDLTALLPASIASP
jgi:adenosylcobyric acid synthase